jgi:hypothetical protein
MISAFTGGYLSKKQVTLGRLVLNLQDPGQAFFPNKPRHITKEDVDRSYFEEIEVELEAEAESKFQLRLTKLFRTTAASSASSSDKLTAQKATRWQLLNSDTVFTSIIGDRNTREWLESVCKHSPVHFVVGLITILNPSVNNAAERKLELEASGDIPFAEAVAPGSSTLPVAGDALDLKAEVSKSKSEEQNAKFLAPGDRIIGVQYRRVNFKGFKSADIGLPHLETKNRWKKYTGGDIVRGDMEDVLEANLESTPTLDGLEELYTFTSFEVDKEEREIILVTCPSM